MNYDILPVIKNIQCNEDISLSLEFTNGKNWVVNCIPKNSESIYSRFLDRKYFQKAKLNKHKNTVERDNDLDMDGYGLYLEIIWSHGSNQ